MIINKAISIIRLYTIIFCITTLYSCNKSSIITDFSNIETITIDYENGPIVCFDSIVSDIKFIKLETKENNMIGDIYKMLITNDRIIIADKFSSKSVHLFDISGKHISKLSNLGNGPQEFLNITDVDITPSGLIAIKDNYKDILLYYNMDGEFVKKEDILEGGSEIAFIDDHIIAHEIFQSFIPERFKGASLCIAEDNKIRTLFGKDGGKIGVMNINRANTMFDYNGNVYYNPSWEKIMYRITADSILARYLIELKPEDMLDHKFETSEEWQELHEIYNFFNGSFIEMKNNIWLNYYTPEAKEPPVIYSRKDKVVYRIHSKFNNPLLNYLQKPIALYNENTVAEAVPAFRVYVNQLMINNISGHSAITDSLHNGLTVDDNPIIFLFTIKDDIGKYVIEE